MKFFLQAIILMVFSMSVSAQHPKVIKARSLVSAGKISKAVSLLKKSYNKTGDKEFGKELIQLFAKDNNISAAFDWSINIALAESADLDDVLLYTDLLIQQGDYQSALDKCIDYALHHENAQPLYNRAYTCESLLKAEKNSILFTISEIPFNAYTDEISITNFRRQYVMSSNRVTEMADGTSNQDYFDFYMLQKDFNKWRYPSFLLKDRDNLHNRTTLCYSMDGNQVYYTLSDYQTAKARKKGPQIEPVFRLYQGISMGNEWVETGMLAFQKDGYDYKDPAIHPDGGMLVYSSNHGSSGGFDLFYSEWRDEQWSSPVNLGPQVNSEADEVMAYFDEEGRLFFSSDKNPGFGGFDIYETRLDNGIWLKPKIMAPPINSAYDDLSFTRHYSMPGGYIVSNRPGGKGGYDIYEFVEIDLQLGVTVLDRSNGNLVEFAEVKLLRDGILLEHRLTNEKGIAEFRIGKNTGYEILVTKEGYLDTETTLHSRVATEGRTLFWNVKLPEDPDFEATEITGPEKGQNFIEFTAEVVDQNDKPIPNLTVRLINTNSLKMKLVTTDEEGKFSQSLLLGNNYEFIMEHKGERFVGVFSTIGLKDKSPKQARYTIGEN